MSNLERIKSEAYKTNDIINRAIMKLKFVYKSIFFSLATRGWEYFANAKYFSYPDIHWTGYYIEMIHLLAWKI